ncbi:hypothetical protein SARC_01636 [Sphaeroforma arctica JP610]|uniref:Uncharacterized protein n=1 Tax=Sphaeroforma arctica JP610 TaxID=667725 RepID=A0A0L0GBC0_9EUKA|nr:hypothetical protein SARC_01636 [Sphaeroforma arctica JP610]KNC86199.1 hypothetical protein SARC_01636 [Sphaeroforma arctica JP610]|eukprot:XP_014160101.1 hypothetical protein SARC_01636 [Sphaeroforma arctica JP610]
MATSNQIESAVVAQLAPHIPMTQKLAVGALAGVVGTCFIFPVDVVKTRLQAQKPDVKTGKLPYTGIVHAFKTIVGKEGFRSLYKGLTSNLIGVMPEKAIKLSVNDGVRELLTDPVTGKISISNQIIAGASAGFFQVSATNPMEIVKLRMQLQNMKPVEQRLGTIQVVKNLGVKGLYKGILVTWMRDVPYSIVFFPLYATLRDKFADERGVAGIPQIIMAGNIAGAVAAFACTPADTIKTRFQSEGSSYKSIGDCFKQTVKNEGVKALFKGSVPRMLVTGPLFGVALLAFEMQKRYITGQPLF